MMSNSPAVLRLRFEECACGDVFVTVFQAKCLLMRLLGVSVRARDIHAFLVEGRGRRASLALSSSLENRDAAAWLGAPQLAPLEPLAGEGTAAEGSIAQEPSAPSSVLEPLEALVAESPAGYVSFEQFQHLVEHHKRQEGITFATATSKLYGALDPPRRGHVEASSVARLLSALGKPRLASRAPLYFGACDKLGIGRVSTTQALSVLQAGAAALSG